MAAPQVPGALFRGGDFLSGSFAGVFAVAAYIVPSDSNAVIGFRLPTESSRAVPL
jgi:hypothetical protein